MTYEHMKELFHHLQNGVVKRADQLNPEVADFLDQCGMLKKMGAVNMWTVSPRGGQIALDNIRLYRWWPVISGVLFFLSASAKERLFDAMIRF